MISWYLKSDRNPVIVKEPQANSCGVHVKTKFLTAIHVLKKSLTVVYCSPPVCIQYTKRIDVRLEGKLCWENPFLCISQDGGGDGGMVRRGMDFQKQGHLSSMFGTAQTTHVLTSKEVFRMKSFLFAFHRYKAPIMCLGQKHSPKMRVVNKAKVKDIYTKQRTQGISVLVAYSG